jgi:hypothetical protein
MNLEWKIHNSINFVRNFTVSKYYVCLDKYFIFVVFIKKIKLQICIYKYEIALTQNLCESKSCKCGDTSSICNSRTSLVAASQEQL